MLSAKFWTRRRLTIGAVVLAVLLRTWAVLLLPTDFDEPVYMGAAFDYARALRNGDLNGIVDYPQNREHPALVKLLYAGGLLALGSGAPFQWARLSARAISAVLGVAAVAVMALAGNPVSALLLAIHTMTVKYTSQAYLEALPMLTSMVAVVAFVRLPPRSETEHRPVGRWFWVSAVALGLTAAGKFTYVPVALVVILYLATWEKDIQWPAIVPFFLVVGAVFWLADPTLWHQPISRLAGAILYLADYTRGTQVQAAAYPWFQPLIWVSTSAPATWHPEVFFYYGFDGFMFLFAAAGLKREWRERRWTVIWLAAGLLFMLLWPTKWPQYSLIVVPAICLMAGTTLVTALRWLREQDAYYGWLAQMMPAVPWYFWVFTGLTVLFVATIYMWGLLSVSLGSIGWSHLTAQSSLMPSNTVQAILTDAAGRVVVGTDRGAAIWLPPGAGSSPGAPLLFNMGNSGLPSDQVLALAQDAAGNLWFGTTAGVARFDGQNWMSFGAADLGLADAQVQALAIDRAGRLYAGTRAGGATVWDGRHWTPLPTASAGPGTGLADPHVFTLAVRPAVGGDELWLGTLTGVSVLETASDRWRSFSLAAMQAGSGGVANLMIDSAGRVWAATLGGGLSVWDGGAWRNYNPSNSGLPHATVNAAYEVSPGIIWVASSLPTDVGGVVSVYDGKTWRNFLPRNSGFSGAEPLVLTLDRRGQVWIGTRTAGMDIVQLKN
jgi:ligand-binding sensor domain-containing protein